MQPKWQQIIQWLRWPFLALSLGFVVYKLFNIEGRQWQQLLGNLGQYGYGWPVLALVLMPLNWLTETLRWHLVTADALPKQRFINTLFGVLSGLALSWGAPMGAGDLLGRASYATPGRRRLLAGKLLVNRLTMAAITLAFGLPAFLYWLANGQLAWWVTPVGALLVLAGWGLLRSLAAFLPHKKGMFWEGLLPLHNTPRRVWVVVLALTLLRYCIFVTQFVVLLYWAVGSTANVGLLVRGVAFIMFAKTYLPAFSGMADLGLRELTGIVFFEKFGVNPGAVVLAGFSIWVVNILIPSVVGFWLQFGHHKSKSRLV